MTFGDRLKAERKRLGLSQEALGARGGVATNAQGNYEAEKRTPDANYLAGVAAAGVDVFYVLTGGKASRDIDLATFGICEAALRKAYQAVRAGTPDSVAFRTRYVCRIYNQAINTQLRPGDDLAAIAYAAAQGLVEGVDDPDDPAGLDRVLIHPAMRESAVQQTIVVKKKGGRHAGRDFIQGGIVRPGKKK